MIASDTPALFSLHAAATRARGDRAGSPELFDVLPLTCEPEARPRQRARSTLGAGGLEQPLEGQAQ